MRAYDIFDLFGSKNIRGFATFLELFIH